MLGAIVLAAAISSGDAQFVRSAMQFNDGELSRAEIAVDSTNLPQREFAERISADIGAANQQLIALDRHLRVTLDTLPNPQAGAPATAQPQSSTNVAKIRLLSSTLAPKPYFQAEIAQERAAISLYERESSAGQNAALRDFARTTLTQLRADLALAQRYSREESSR
jgi:predicted outer membrane protein